MTDRSFDPRFNPAFQRGFEGQAVDAPAPAPRTDSAPSSARIGTPPPARLVTPEQPFAPRTPTADAVFTGLSGTDSSLGNSFFEETEYEPAPRRVNVFLIALGIVAVLLVGGGLFLVSRLRDLYDDTQAGYDWVTLQVLTFGAPLLIGLGLVTGIGLLFVFALRGRRA